MRLVKHPLVSISIPTCNRADLYFRQALASALNQTYPNIEIIVADNCSSDGTGELVESLKDPRIRYTRHSANIGANNNFNFCLNQARGDYFLLLHDDDLIDETFTEACMNALSDDSNPGIIRTGTRIIDKDGSVLNEVPNTTKSNGFVELMFAWLNDETSLFMCSTLFNRKTLLDIGGFNSKTNLYQDVVAEFKLAATHGHLEIPEVKASFRRHDDNRGAKTKTMAWCEDSAYLLEVMCDLAQDEKAELSRRARRYFAAKCYKKAKNIDSLVERLSTYAAIYRYFQYAYSPFGFIIQNRYKRLAARLQY